MVFSLLQFSVLHGPPPRMQAGIASEKKSTPAADLQQRQHRFVVGLLQAVHDLVQAYVPSCSDFLNLPTRTCPPHPNKLRPEWPCATPDRIGTTSETSTPSFDILSKRAIYHCERHPCCVSLAPEFCITSNVLLPLLCKIT